MKNKSTWRSFLIVLALVWVGHTLTYKFFPPIPAKGGFPLTQKWMTKFGSNIFSLSVAHDGTLLIRTAYLNAVDPSTGQVKWRILLDHEIDSDAGMEKDGVIYVTTPTSLLAIQLETGNVVWKEHIARGNLVVGVSEDIILLSGYSEDFSAHDAKTGKNLWKYYVYEKLVHTYIIDAEIFTARNGVSTISRSTGEKTWGLNTGFINTSAQSGNFIFFSTEEQAGCFDTNSKALVWSVSLPGYFYREYAFWNDSLIVTAQHHIYALDRTSGKILWKQNIETPANPTVIGDTIFVMEGFGREIIAFDARSGTNKGSLISYIPQLFYVERKDMIASGEFLIFARGNRLFAFSE